MWEILLAEELEVSGGLFLPALIDHFRDLTDANQQLMAWVMEEAGNRCHGRSRVR